MSVSEIQKKHISLEWREREIGRITKITAIMPVAGGEYITHTHTLAPIRIYNNGR